MKQEKPRITDHLKGMIAIASLGEILPKSLDTAFNNDLKKVCSLCGHSFENHKEAGLYDICDWWIETYPPDIFIQEPKPIVEARLCMQNILARRGYVITKNH